MRVRWGCTFATACVGGQKATLGSGSLLPSCGVQGLNPGLQAQWQAPLLMEQLASPLDISEPSDASTVEGKGVTGLESLCLRVSLDFAPPFFHENSPHLCNLSVFTW